MPSTNQFSLQQEVDRLFNEVGARRGEYCRNPITGGAFVWGVDPVSVQKRDAAQLLHAREWFAENGPPDAPALPLSHDQIDDARNAGGLQAVAGFYARSLASRGWDVEQHPSFVDFACGLMAANIAGWGIGTDTRLPVRFPPRPLAGMGPDLRWRPPAEHTRHMAMLDRWNVRAAA